MNRTEFEQLRDLPGKRIDGNITFSLKKGSRPLHLLDAKPVQNELGVDLILLGSFNSEINKLTIQFFVRGIGPICRVCINGRVHNSIGRTHKHDLHEEDDPANNLPVAHERLDLCSIPLESVWEKVCKQANIHHDGAFQLPGGGL